jgi:RpiB/LacA/LacB family sugar-phosphate isomerase
MKKYNLVVPIAGLGKRMKNGGFETPKPMLICGNKSILEWSMNSIYHKNCNTTFVVQKDHVKNFGIDSWLSKKWPDSRVSIVNGLTSGAAQTALLGCQGIIDGSLPLIVFCPDTHFEEIYTPKDEDFESEGFILTFKANSDNYSYVVEENGFVKSTIEKVVPENSNLASVGVYGFKNTRLFKEYAERYCYKNYPEHHVCPMYNDMINRGLKVKQKSVEKVHIMGTPEEFKFFEEVSYKYLIQNRKFAICCDHSGFELKEKIVENFKFWGVPQYIDFGCFTSKDCDYNSYVKTTCDFVLKNKDYFGIGICRSGQGVNICANKIPGIRSAMIPSIYHAKYAIKHNAANFFSLSANDFDSKEKLEEVLDVLYNETFDGGRHQNRMMKNG